MLRFPTLAFRGINVLLQCEMSADAHCGFPWVLPSFRNAACTDTLWPKPSAESATGKYPSAPAAFLSQRLCSDCSVAVVGLLSQARVCASTETSGEERAPWTPSMTRHAPGLGTEGDYARYDSTPASGPLQLRLPRSSLTL